MPAPAQARRSLRFRLLAATVLALGVALLLAGLLLASLFKDHVTRQFTRTLTTQLDQLTARLEFQGEAPPTLDERTLTDPRWTRPYAGLYWQVDRAATAGTPLQRGVRRSRSLWDVVLEPPADALADGELHVHEVAGPGATRLLLLERTVAVPGASAAWRVMVAADLAETAEAVSRFNGVLVGSLAILLVLMGGAAVAQVAVGLAPLRALQRALAAVQEGRAQRLDGPVPGEVQPLVDGFNRVLDRNAEVVARARTQAGNLAHAIKTPLAVLAQAAEADRAGSDDAVARAALPGLTAELVAEQVALARRHVDWHLARSRAAAAQGLPGARAALQPAVAGLVRVMQRVHAQRGLELDADSIAPDLHAAVEQQDLQEMAGNLIDNACQWARHAVRIHAEAVPGSTPPRLRLVIDDDGPGIAPERRAAVVARGARLDESVPGSGLGLAIVQELALLYGGRLVLADSPLGGLRAELELPLA